MRIRQLLLLCVILAPMLVSCYSNRDMIYFKNIDSKPEELESIYNEYAVKVRPADQLLITVYSEVPEATAMYNLPQVEYAEKADLDAAKESKLLPYVVDPDGFITMPIIGKLNVKGLTTSEVADLVAERISKDVHNPYVRVEMASFRVNVMGEVAKPGAVEVKTERYSILDALSDAGDLTQYGCRNNVLLIREENGKRTYHRLDLTDAGLLTSPYFYMQQNDVIYVEPNDVRQSNAEYDQNKSYKVQVISTAISAISVIATLIIALVIK